MKDRDLRRNASGCFDPTAYQAIKNIDRENENFHKLLHTIFEIVDSYDFEVEGRIILRDRNTGKVWR